MGTSIDLLRKYIILCCFFVGIIGCTEYKSAYLRIKKESGKKEYPKKKYFFKEYALCSCLTQAFQKDSSIIKDASISVYYDLSDDELSMAGTGKKIDSNVLKRTCNQ